MARAWRPRHRPARHAVGSSLLLEVQGNVVSANTRSHGWLASCNALPQQLQPRCPGFGAWCAAAARGAAGALSWRPTETHGPRGDPYWPMSRHVNHGSVWPMGASRCPGLRVSPPAPPHAPAPTVTAPMDPFPTLTSLEKLFFDGFLCFCVVLGEVGRSVRLSQLRPP